MPGTRLIRDRPNENHVTHTYGVRTSGFSSHLYNHSRFVGEIFLLEIWILKSMARLGFLLLCSLLVLGISAASSVIDLLPSNFDQIILKSGKPALVEFFAPWCGHCQALVNTWEELATKYEFAKDKVTIARVDADDHKELGRRFGVQGFPTLKWFDGKSDKPTDYSGGRDLDSLSDFITEKTGIKIKSKTSVLSAVEMLTDQTFKKNIGSDKDVLVAFTAPWCGRKSFTRPLIT